MYSQLSILLINIACSYCFATYEIFHGFEDTSNSSVFSRKQTKDHVSRTSSTSSTSTTTPSTMKPVTKAISTRTVEHSTIGQTTGSTQRPARLRYKCPEEELPSNIGPYEVPTERDLVLHIKETLSTMFESYHSKAFYFLKDIKQATKATIDIEKKCSDKVAYRKCVKQASTQCEYFTKSLVTALEKQREDVANLTEDAICNITSMKSDPIQLIKTLAMEESTLDFALPGFLRLLNRCSSYCPISNQAKNATKPPRHLTDKDLVVMYFLSKNRYLESLKKTNQKL